MSAETLTQRQAEKLAGSIVRGGIKTGRFFDTIDIDTSILYNEGLISLVKRGQGAYAIVTAEGVERFKKYSFECDENQDPNFSLSGCLADWGDRYRRMLLKFNRSDGDPMPFNEWHVSGSLLDYDERLVGRMYGCDMIRFCTKGPRKKDVPIEKLNDPPYSLDEMLVFPTVRARAIITAHFLAAEIIVEREMDKWRENHYVEYSNNVIDSVRDKVKWDTIIGKVGKIYHILVDTKTQEELGSVRALDSSEEPFRSRRHEWAVSLPLKNDQAPIVGYEKSRQDAMHRAELAYAYLTGNQQSFLVDGSDTRDIHIITP